MRTANKPLRASAWFLAWILGGMALVAAPSAASAQISLGTVVDLAQKNSSTVKLAQADVQKAAASLSQTKDAFIPSLSFGSGLPAFPEVGYTGNLPSIWDATIQSMVFSMPQLRNIQAARAGLQAAQLSLKDAREQSALDAATAYIEMDTVQSELEAARQQEEDAGRLIDIEQQRTDAGVDALSDLLQARLTAAQLKLNRLHLETRAATLAQATVCTYRPSLGIDYARSRKHSRGSRDQRRYQTETHGCSAVGRNAGAFKRTHSARRQRAHMAASSGFRHAI